MATEVMERRPRTESGRAEHMRAGTCFYPAVDIVERADELTLFADMPGTDASNIDVNFENGTLTICGRVQRGEQQPEARSLCEYGIGDFCRSFEVSEAIDASRITAEYVDGVLTLHLPKTEGAKPRKIAVRAE